MSKYLLALLLFSLPVMAQQPVTHILAVHFFNNVAKAPVLVEPFGDSESCQTEALKRNKVDENLRRPDLRAMGAEYVCLKIERVIV